MKAKTMLVVGVGAAVCITAAVAVVSRTPHGKLLRQMM